MQVGACQPVSFCLEYNLRQDEHAVTGNTVHLNSWQSVSRRWVLDRRTSGRGVAPTTDVAAVLSRLSRDCLKFDTAIPTIGSKIEVGNAPKADIERLDLKCREGPL